MATYPPVRRPLTNRSVQGPSNPSPSKQTRTVSGSKRPLSPDHGDFHASSTVKRARSANTQETPTPQDSRGPEKGKKASERIEREQKAIEFKDKYSRAFPTFKFYFDYENVGPKDAVQLKSMILRLGGVMEAFFSSSVTHLITNYAVPNPDKENSQVTTKVNNNQNALRSPIKLLGRGRRKCNIMQCC